MADQKPQDGSQKPQEGQSGSGSSQGSSKDDQKKSEPYSHVLLLADGSRKEWAADDANPHGPVPSEVDGVPVVNVVHAYEQKDAE